MADLTEAQALHQAQELRNEFSQHVLMKARRAQISREAQPDISKLGITDADVQQVVPWSSDAANQEAHLYATALSLAEAQVEVYVQSEQPKKQTTGEKIEGFHQAIVDQKIGDQYDTCRNIASVGVGIQRIDELGQFFSAAPEREDGEEPDAFAERVKEHRQAFGLPFDIIDIDPQTCYYVENQKRTEVELACQFLPMRESRIKDGGDPTLKGEMVIVRSPKTWWHFWVPGQGVNPENMAQTVIDTGENRLGHTGYILYRGRYTGFSDPQRRYDPYIMSTLNISEAASLYITLQSELLVQTLQHWVEREPSQGRTPLDREASLDRKLRGGGGAVRSSGGNVAAEFGEGERVRYRDIVGDIAAVLSWLQQEYDLYRFRDVLMGEASGDASGRAIIRLQEAAGRQLSPGMRAREQGIAETLRVIRGALFSRPEYLKDSKDEVYSTRMLAGDDAGDVDRMGDLISLSAADDVPHEIRVRVSAESRAAQLALLEEGKSLWEMPDPMLSRDTIMRDFLRVGDLPAENRRKVKDGVRGIMIPAAIQDGAAQGLAELQRTPLQRRGVVMPQNGAGGPGGGTPGTSGAPDAVLPEDAAEVMAPTAEVV